MHRPPGDRGPFVFALGRSACLAHPTPVRLNPSTWKIASLCDLLRLFCLSLVLALERALRAARVVPTVAALRDAGGLEEVAVGRSATTRLGSGCKTMG